MIATGRHIVRSYTCASRLFLVLLLDTENFILKVLKFDDLCVFSAVIVHNIKLLQDLQEFVDNQFR